MQAFGMRFLRLGSGRSRAAEIEAKNSQKYACGLTEQDVESGWECPLDNPNETVKRCEDCAFAKETD